MYVRETNTVKSCLECIYCKLNPHGKSNDEDYNGYHCNYVGKKICDEKDLTKISQIQDWCRRYYVL
jgi:phage-related protein